MYCNSFRRSEEHTSELQSRLHLVCRLLLEKKIRARPKNFLLMNLILCSCRSLLLALGARGSVRLAPCSLLFDRFIRSVQLLFFFLMTRRPRSFPLFPHPALFR